MGVEVINFVGETGVDSGIGTFLDGELQPTNTNVRRMRIPLFMVIDVCSYP
jgi:hypothetical protein